MDGLKNWAGRLFHRLQRPIREVREAIRRQYDLLAYQSLEPLNRRFLPLGGSAVRPAGLETILSDIQVNDRRVITECGSGASTLYIARLLDTFGGKLFSIEHDKGWLEVVSEMIYEEGLGKNVDFIHAPLNDTGFPYSGTSWYNTDEIEKHISESIDLLFVDGPPAYSEELELARYPAYPFFRSFLSDEFTILVDDISRHGTTLMVDAWEGEGLSTVERRFYQGDIGVARRGEFYSA
jgi:predicted O-methyltransferase YrrM